MVGAVSSLAGTYAAGSGASEVGLRAQVMRERKALSACINCSSAETPEGNRKIRELSDQLAHSEARLGQLESRTASPHAAQAALSERPAPAGSIDVFA